MSTDVFPGAVLRQLVEWGFPLGALRSTPPSAKAFSVVHITGNSRLPSADGEITWRQTDPALQNSATFFVNRDGSIRQALGDPLHMAPWANGVIREADRSNDRIAAVLADGVNPNIRTIVAIENVGYEPGSPLTEAQKKANARIITYYHQKADVPVNRETVIGHYQIDGVERQHCPSHDHSVVDEIVALATEEDPQVIAELKARIEELEEVAARRFWKIKSLTAKRDALLVELAEAEALIETLEPLAETNEELRRVVNRLRERVAGMKAKVAAFAADLADD